MFLGLFPLLAPGLVGTVVKAPVRPPNQPTDRLMTQEPFRTLIVEDDEDQRTLLKRILQSRGHEVVACGAAEEGLSAYQRDLFPLVILDVMLPGIDGYSLQIKISQDDQTKNIPIIVMTALEPSRPLFKKFPQVVGFLTKPFGTDELLTEVGKVLPPPS